MRNTLIGAVLLSAATSARAQSPPAAPPPPAKVNWVDAALASMNTKKPESGGAPSATMLAQEVVNSVRGICVLVPRDEQLVAACDNSTPQGRTRLPRVLDEWQRFAGRLQAADRELNRKPRGLLVLNGTETMAEITAAGVLVPRK